MTEDIKKVGINIYQVDQIYKDLCKQYRPDSFSIIGKHLDGRIYNTEKHWIHWR